MKKSTCFLSVSAIMGICCGIIGSAYYSMGSQEATTGETVVVPVTIEIPAECAGQEGDCILFEPIVVASK